MIQMSATFYPAIQGTKPPSSIPELHLQKENRWEYVPDMPEVNLCNSNARSVLEALGLDPNFEESDTSAQTIDDFIERCHAFLYGEGDELEPSTRPTPGNGKLTGSGYLLHKVAMLLVSAELGRQGGATHWYFA